MIDIEALKAANPIEDVIVELTGFELRGQGKHLTPRDGTKEGGLVVNVDDQLYFWNGHNRGGDVVSFLEKERDMSFVEALRWLAKRAGMPLHMDEVEAAKLASGRKRSDVFTWSMEWMMGRLAESAAATAYVVGRGWTLEAAQEARLGFWDGDRKGLAAELKLHGVDVANDDVAQAVLSFPAGMLMYGHWVGGRCEYISGRAVEGKRHHNPPVNLVGERKVFWNRSVTRQITRIVVVEGQADAVTLGMWNVPAVALAGTHANETLIKQLGGYATTYLALDADASGQKNVMEMAAELGPMCKIVTWPAQTDEERPAIKDANDWLRYGDGDAEACSLLLANSPIYALWLCEQVEAAGPLHREEMLNRAVATIARMKPYAYERHNKSLINALPDDIGKRELNNMVKALQKNNSVHRTELVAANGFVDGHLFELVCDYEYEGGPRTALAVRYPDGRQKIVSMLETENHRIMPPSAWDEKVIRTRTLRLPSEITSYDSDALLQQEVQAFIHKYVDTPPEIEKMASYYVMLTWLFDKFYVLPYLRARGNSDSGKSRFIETVGELCLRALYITGSTTPSPVFRTMEKYNGVTVIMDEADLPHSETSSDWIQMLNTGYKKGFGILRTSMSNGEATVDVFSGFGPKILNMRGRFADDATESRCLTWETKPGRAIRDDIPRFITDREGYLADAQALRNKLLNFRLRRWGDVQPDYNHEAMKHMPGRLVEITVPLFSITDEQEFKDGIMEFVEYMNQDAIMERSTTLAAKVLHGILQAYYLPDEKAQDMPTQLQMQVAHITRQTNRIINAENREASLYDDDDDDGSGDMRSKKQVSSGYVGKLIKDELNLKTSRATIGNRPMILEWDMDRIGALIIRYGYEELVGELTQKAEARRLKATENLKKELNQGEINL